MLRKLFNFFAASAATPPPFRQQLYVAGAACLSPDEGIRTYSTTFKALHPTPRIMGFPCFSAAEPEQTKPDALQFGFIRREAIFSHQAQRAIGHELMLNNSSELLGGSVSPMLRRMHDELLLKSILTLDRLQLPGDDLVFISLSPGSLEHELLPQLPSRNVVLAFRPELENADKLIERCRELRAHGFRFALDDFTYSAGFYPLLSLVDYVRFDISSNSILELEPQLERIPRLAEKTLIAKNVHTSEIQKIASRLSFRHYQGSHFSLGAPVGQALLEHDGPYAPFLKLAIACENHDQPSIEHHAEMAGISIEQVNTAYVKALVWTHEIEN